MHEPLTRLPSIQVFIMVLPLMFLAGMCLIDTINGVLMALVYGSGADGSMQRLRLARTTGQSRRARMRRSRSKQGADKRLALLRLDTLSCEPF